MTNRAVGIYDITNTVVNTVAERELVALTVPAYGLAATNMVRFTVAGDFLNNSGSSDTVLFKVKLGTSVALTTPAVSLANSANRRQWRLVVDVLAEGDALQRLSAVLHFSDDTADNFGPAETYLVGYGTDTEDGTATVDVSVTATLGTAAATLDIRSHMALLEAVHGSLTAPTVTVATVSITGTATVTSSLTAS